MKLRNFRDAGGHSPRYISRQLGCAPLSGRPLYGWTVKCECGFERRTNESKRHAEKIWRDHTRDEWKKPAP